jgi:hypothetical protein
MTLHNAVLRAKSKGWFLVASTQVHGDGCQAPGSITLCEIPGAHPYVIHFFNAQDGGFHSGTYCRDMDTARREFSRQSERYTRHHVRRSA